MPRQAQLDARGFCTMSVSRGIEKTKSVENGESDQARKPGEFSMIKIKHGGKWRLKVPILPLKTDF